MHASIAVSTGEVQAPRFVSSVAVRKTIIWKIIIVINVVVHGNDHDVGWVVGQDVGHIVDRIVCRVNGRDVGWKIYGCRHRGLVWQL